ncbi:MAG TPA: hypothetical protein VFE78_25415 [Gemmataceae bacterium]|jgi:hypothetical protein|nr:hypothetical protein [Gemmataceae bacterium]
MSGLLQLSLIRFFGFYLAVMFLLGTLVRVRQYRTFLNLVRAMPGRWPRLLKLVGQHGHIFLTWGTVMPLALSLALVLANWVASTLLWPQANDFTVARLLESWPALAVVLLSGAAMLAMDGYCCWVVGEVDQAEMEKYFDQAEYWLRSWTAPVVHFFTLGYINPRQMVAVEVRAALVSASQLLNSTLWWVVGQTGLRILFGLALWGSYALQPWLRG